MPLPQKSPHKKRQTLQGEVGRGSGRVGVRCRNLRRDTDIRFTLSLA